MTYEYPIKEDFTITANFYESLLHLNNSTFTITIIPLDPEQATPIKIEFSKSISGQFRVRVKFDQTRIVTKAEPKQQRSHKYEFIFGWTGGSGFG